MEKPKFVYVTYINSTPEKVFEALTKPEFTVHYWGGHRIQSDWTLGAPVKFLKETGTGCAEGAVLQYDPPKLLAYTFRTGPPDKPEEKEDSRVAFEITTAHGVTKLTVTHDFEPGTRMFAQVSGGWQAVLSSLKTLLETGKAIPYAWNC